MDLFPTTQPQAYEMLWCAGQCGNLNGSTSSSSGSSPDVNISFEDYSIFASEMKRAYVTDNRCQIAAAPASKIPHKDNESKLPSESDFISKCNVDKSSVHYEVFLGGACNPTTWRQDIAVPLLKDLGITFFNPQVTNWEPGLIELEHEARENSDVLFYVLDNQTRGLVVMIEVAYFVAKQRNVVLVITGFKEPGLRICNEPISQIEYENLTCSQLILQDLVERHGIPVFNDIPAALNCTAKIVREKIRPQDLKLSDLAQPVKKGILQIGNKLINLRKTFENLDSKSSGEISLSHVLLAYRILTNGELTKDAVRNVLESLKRIESELSQPIPPSNDRDSSTVKKELNGVNGATLNLDQFCCIMSELVLNHYRNSAKSLSNLLSNKASYVVQNISIALTRLLEHVPGSKDVPGWMPLLSKQESEEVVTHPTYDVYLGGDDSDSWRTEAVSVLRKQGLSCLNPEISHSSKSKSIPIDKGAIDRCRVVLLNVSSSSRSIEFMTMAVYYVGLGYRVVLCIGYLQDECQIHEEKLSKVAIKDYNRGRSYLTDIAKREEIPIFENVQEALNCCIDKCKNLNNSNTNSSS